MELKLEFFALGYNWYYDAVKVAPFNNVKLKPQPLTCKYNIYNPKQTLHFMLAEKLQHEYDELILNEVIQMLSSNKVKRWVEGTGWTSVSEN